MSDLMKYQDAVKAIKTAILKSQLEAVQSVNETQLLLYLGIGKYVSENTRSGAWGTNAIEVISEQLQKEMPGLRGFSATNIKLMRKFYEAYLNQFFRIEIRQSRLTILDSVQNLANNPCLLVDDNERNLETTAEENMPAFQNHPSRWLNLDNVQFESSQEGLVDDSFQRAFFGIGFSLHAIIFSRCKDDEERWFYIQKTFLEKWSQRKLISYISQDLYHHQGKMPNNFMEALPQASQALKAIEVFKDEYLLDILNTEELGIRDIEDVDERVLEKGIVHNIRKNIMAFGKGFAFIGEQFHVEAFGKDHYIDLLFFHRDLNCLVAIELKKGEFKPAYLGQLQSYLSLLDQTEKKPHEGNTIGIVLCSHMDKPYVEFIIRDYRSPMGVATYITTQEVPEQLKDKLPDIESLKAILRGEEL